MKPLTGLKLFAGTRVFSVRTATILRQFNFYTKRARIFQEAEKLTKLDTQQSSKPSSSQGIKNQSVASTIWSKPRKIPYQPKVANFINLVGRVKEPVRFEVAPDGKHFAAIVISQETRDRKYFLSIPVVFEGDLAQIVTRHVKQNDHVLVSGRLSEEPLQILGCESFGRFHVVADDLNFVEGLNRNFAPKIVDASFSGVEIEKPGDVVEPKTEKRVSVVENERPGDVVEPKTEMRVSRVEIEKPEDVIEPKTVKSVYKKKNDDEVWRDLVNFPDQWWDYRGHKSRGLVKNKYPDFKQKSTGDPLWINTAPSWALSMIQNLEFDTRQVMGKSDNREDLCKSFVENPADWWDNRVGKRNPRAPDFKHKKTGEVLWLNELPDWALSRLPPVNNTNGKDNLQA